MSEITVGDLIRRGGPIVAACFAAGAAVVVGGVRLLERFVFDIRRQ